MKEATETAPLMTAEAFLEMEYHAEEKHEFVDGRVILYNSGDTGIYMAGASPNHNEIADTLRGLLFIYLRELNHGFFAYGSDQMVAIGESQQKFYPDISVASKPLEFADPKSKRVISNASVVIEVLSESTMRYDLTTKLAAYQQHEGLKQIVYVDSQVMMVLSYVRTPNGWQTDGPYSTPADVLQIPSLGFNAQLGAIYGTVLGQGNGQVN